MGKFLNPFTDVGFKIIFGQEVSKPLLINFLNTLLEGEKKIEDLTFLDKEVPGFFRDDRTIIYDLLCTTDTGENIIVEMQNKNQPNFIERCIFYCAQGIARQSEKGPEWQYDVDAVYLVAILNFRMNTLGDALRTDVKLVNMQTGKVFSDKERLIFLQMPCFKKETKDCENDFERWIYVLKNMEVLERMPWKAKNSVFERLAKIAEVRNLTKEERLQYDASLKRYRDTMNIMRGEREEGRQEGRQEGLKEGRKEGLKEGRLEGLKEGEEKGRYEAKIGIARNMKNGGMSWDQIRQSTGLTTEEIEAL